MKKLLLAIKLILALALSGCGGDVIEAQPEPEVREYSYCSGLDHMTIVTSIDGDPATTTQRPCEDCRNEGDLAICGGMGGAGALDAGDE